MSRLGLRLLAVGVIGFAALAATVVALNLRGEANLDAELEYTGAPAPDGQVPAEQIAQGAYLARAGNCMACHTARGGEPYAGGRGIDTPFGTVFSSNLTPDAETGLGRWSAPQFWRALHHGRSADGRLLVPAFPYTSTTQVSRADSDALYAYLRSLPAVVSPAQPHDLRFPFNTQAALAVWRALYFKPGVFEPDATRSAEWNRGAYLVQGLGHCNACHAKRNALGATAGPLDLGGGLIPIQNWYAPSLTDPREAGVADWPETDIVALLKTGVVDRRSSRVTASGPMGEVVLRSTQHLSDADLGAMATYLKTLGTAPAAAVEAVSPSASTPAVAGRGAKLYEDHCAACHGEQGDGVAGAYPSLAGNRAVTMTVPANLVRIVLEGGFAPSTSGHPRPYGMPPFGQTLSNDDIAVLLTHLRSNWGNRAQAVSSVEVNRYRGSGAR
ncbi:MAG: cytochrome c [Burkholderiaceae bacterium]|nr:cytochrome c [Burkholderiaceae bacterium]